MSYVIQNFLDRVRRVNATPRFRRLLVLNNLEKLLIFIKFASLLRFNGFYANFMTGRFYLFVRYMFAKQPVRILCGTDLTSMGCYANNVTVASAYSVFKNFDGALVRPAAFAVSALESDYRCNLYLLSHRILSIRPRASVFRGAFFSLMLSSPSL